LRSDDIYAKVKKSWKLALNTEQGQPQQKILI